MPLADFLEVSGEHEGVVDEFLREELNYVVVEFAWPLGLPLVRPLGRSLWEVRSSLTQGRIARIIFCASGGQMVLLHGFIKKTQATPTQEIDLALKRMKGDAQ